MSEFYIFFEHKHENKKINSILEDVGYSYKNFDEESGEIRYENEKKCSLDLILTNNRSDGLNKITFYPNEDGKQKDSILKLKEFINFLKQQKIVIKSIRDIKNKPVSI